MRMAVRRSITCTCICWAVGGSSPWFREHRHLERKIDEEEKGRSGQITRHTAAVHAPAYGGQDEISGQRREIRGTLGQDEISGQRREIRGTLGQDEVSGQRREIRGTPGQGTRGAAARPSQRPARRRPPRV